MSWTDFFQTKSFKTAIVCVAGIAVLFAVFSVGVFVGSRRAEFSYRWAEAYHRNFAGPKEGFLGEALGKEFISSNGAFGIIANLTDGQTPDSKIITMEERGGVEKIIIAGPRTVISLQRKNLKISDLKIGDNIIVIGQPNQDGQVEAGIIRIMPQPPVINFNPRQEIKF